MNVNPNRIQITEVKAGSDRNLVVTFLTAYVSANVTSIADSHQSTNSIAEKE